MINVRQFLLERRPKSIQINDIAGLLSGEKEMIYLQLQLNKDNEENKLLDEFCNCFKLKRIIMKKGKNIAGEDVYDILIGKNINKMYKTKRLFLSQKLIEWGVDLGYPLCCVKSFKNWHDYHYKDGRFITLIEHTIKNTRQNYIIPFYMNNTTNFYSRLRNEILRKKMNKYLKLNRKIIEKGIDIESFIIWHPCSYDCRESQKKSKNISDFFKKYIPDIYHIRKVIHSKPIIFNDDFEFVILDGKSKLFNDKIVTDYLSIYPFPKTMMKKQHLNLIKKFNKIESKDFKILYPYELSGFFLIPFGE